MDKSVIRVNKWLERNQEQLQPPVCNILMHSDQLKVMFVGGPNERKDFHMQCGEELFYQIRGDMCLRVLESPDKFRDIIIREGEIFLLPGRTFHSPQRPANTMGLVIERNRSEKELDCVRYFVGDTTEPLFERWFYCSNLVTNLPVLINAFFRSEAHKTGLPTNESFIDESSYQPTFRPVGNPFNLAVWVENNYDNLKTPSGTKLFGSPKFTSEMEVFVEGIHPVGKKNSGETFLWQMSGTSSVTSVDDGKTVPLAQQDCILLQESTKYQLDVSYKSWCLSMRMPK